MKNTNPIKSFEEAAAAFNPKHQILSIDEIAKHYEYYSDDSLKYCNYFSFRCQGPNAEVTQKLKKWLILNGFIVLGKSDTHGRTVMNKILHNKGMSQRYIDKIMANFLTNSKLASADLVTSFYFLPFQASVKTLKDFLALSTPTLLSLAEEGDFILQAAQLDDAIAGKIQISKATLTSHLNVTASAGTAREVYISACVMAQIASDPVSFCHWVDKFTLLRGDEDDPLE